jgi:spermidine synthase
MTGRDVRSSSAFDRPSGDSFNVDIHHKARRPYHTEVKPQHTLGRVTTPDGRELVLYVRDGAYSIRVDGRELMTSRAHGSEESLARLILSRFDDTRQPEVLVGGLGMGFTLRAVLDARPRASRVVVAELLPAVVQWNRDELAHLARAPLEDSRVSVYQGDVADLIADNPDTFDAILLDVDNGPAAFTMADNAVLYQPRGLAAIHRSLRPGGFLGVWSSDPDRAFERELRKAQFHVQTETVSARGVAKGPKHTIFVAQRRGRPISRGR